MVWCAMAQMIYEFFAKIVYNLDEDEIRDLIMSMGIAGNELYKISYGEVLVMIFRRKREATETELKMIKENKADFMLADGPVA